jgi:hypothetical protein
VQHVGSAHTEAELGVLLARARLLLEPFGQEVLGLGVEPALAVMPLLSPAAGQAPGQADLLGPVADRGSGEAAAAKPCAAALLGCCPPSRGCFFEALAGVYGGLGFDALGDDANPTAAAPWRQRRTSP